jgi:hypothetical protein
MTVVFIATSHVCENIENLSCKIAAGISGLASRLLIARHEDGLADMDLVCGNIREIGRQLVRQSWPLARLAQRICSERRPQALLTRIRRCEEFVSFEPISFSSGLEIEEAILPDGWSEHLHSRRGDAALAGQARAVAGTQAKNPQLHADATGRGSNGREMA